MTLALLAFMFSYVMCWFVYPGLVRYGIIDRPNERSSHSQPTARGGGVAILLAVLLTAEIGRLQVESRTLSFALLGASTVLAVVSFVDDLRSVPALLRFGCHSCAALGVLAAMGWPQVQLGMSGNAVVAVPEWIGAGLVIVWISGYTNAFNFMDGINGIAAGQAVLTGIGMALLTGLTLGNFTSAPVLLSLVIAGAALGFLPHNFPRARMFMGDVGSAPLGFLLATLVLWQARIAGWWLLVPLGLLHANFALDTGITLLRRMWCHKRWYEAHRDHFYQRFLRAGKTHQWITLWEMSLQALVLGLLLIYIRTGVAGRMLLTGIIIAIWLVFFGWAEIALRRAQGRQISPAGRRMSVSP